MSPEPAVYLNTDLDLAAAFDLQPLADALVARGLVLLTLHPLGAGTFAVLETEASGLGEIQRDISDLLTAVEGLDDEARRQWESCTSRDFNIGYQCSRQPVTFEYGLDEETVARLAAVTASLGITLYPPDDADRIEGGPNAKSL